MDIVHSDGFRKPTATETERRPIDAGIPLFYVPRSGPRRKRLFQGSHGEQTKMSHSAEPPKVEAVKS